MGAAIRRPPSFCYGSDVVFTGQCLYSPVHVRTPSDGPQVGLLEVASTSTSTPQVRSAT
jgi:hypothetical protein